MNARESMAADRDAEDAWERVPEQPHRDATALVLRAIAAELRAARVYANYLEGRTVDRSPGPTKRKIETT